MRHTITDIAERLHVDKDLVRGFVKFLENIALCEFRGTRPSTGNGAAEKVYEFEEGYEKTLMKFLSDGRLTE